MSATTITIALDAAIPEFLVREVQAKLAYLDESVARARVAINRERIELDLRSSPNAGQLNEIEARAKRLVDAMTIDTFEPQSQTLEDFRDRPTRYRDDPMPTLLSSGAVVPEGPGFFTLGPPLAELAEYMSARFIALANRFDAAHYRFPALISPAYMEKVRYFTNFPHSLSFVSHLREDLEVIERFAAGTRTEDGAVVAPDGTFARPVAMLSPTVCHHLYLALAGETLLPGGLTATAECHCFRYESSNMVSLERLWNFTMREIMFVGEPDFVADRLDEVRRLAQPIFADLGLAYSIETASDPFFVDTFRDQTSFQNAYLLKFEIRALLPFKDSTIAAGSYNRHLDFFGRELDIRLADGSPAHTGCVGFGFERLCLAFVAQHGPDPVHWPDPVRQHLAR